MSLLKTITAEEPQARGFWAQGIWIVAIAVGLAVVVGYGISTIDTGDQPAATADAVSNALTHEQFYRLNTEGFAPTLGTRAHSEPLDRFSFVNVGSFEGLLRMYAQRHAVDGSEPPSGPR